MATVSSHILDSVSGTHAVGIRCQLFQLGEPRRLLFDVEANEEGRIVEEVVLDAESSGGEFELVFHGAAYFAGRSLATDSIVATVVLRFAMPDDTKRYHLPVMLSPHSYSTWWSG